MSALTGTCAGSCAVNAQFASCTGQCAVNANANCGSGSFCIVNVQSQCVNGGDCWVNVNANCDGGSCEVNVNGACSGPCPIVIGSSCSGLMAAMTQPTAGSDDEATASSGGAWTSGSATPPIAFLP